MGIRPAITNLVSKENGAGIALAVGVICFFVGIAITALVSSLVHDFEVMHAKRDAEGRLSAARAQLEGEFGELVAFGTGLRGNIAQRRDKVFDPEDYKDIATEIMLENPAIQVILLAPGNIIRGIYPTEGYNQYLGLDYRDHPEVWSSINRAIETHQPVILGPAREHDHDGVLKIRLPIFTSANSIRPVDARTYWGTATMVVDEQMLLSVAGLQNTIEEYSVAIFDRSSLDAASAVLFGDASLEMKDSVSLQLHLPGGLRWELLVYRKNGWAGHTDAEWTVETIGFLVSLIVTLLVILLIVEVYKVRALALHDPLTGLANRRLLEDRLTQVLLFAERFGGEFSIFYIDLDNFKPINDVHGHAAGDEILVEIGKDLLLHTRDTDTVARVGGDEFIVLTPNTMTSCETDAFIERLQRAVNKVHRFGDAIVSVTASIGTASYPRDGQTIDDLLQVADSQMYSSKHRPTLRQVARAKETPALKTC